MAARRVARVARKRCGETPRRSQMVRATPYETGSDSRVRLLRFGHDWVRRARLVPCALTASDRRSMLK